MSDGHLAVVGAADGVAADGGAADGVTADGVTAAPVGLRVETRWHGDRAVLTVAGDVNAATAHVLQEALEAVTAGRPAGVELDLSLATFAGEPPLVRLVEASRWPGGEDSLAVLGTDPSVREAAALGTLAAGRG